MYVFDELNLCGNENTICLLYAVNKNSYIFYDLENTILMNFIKMY
jgi:hypothetical protein